MIYYIEEILTQVIQCVKILLVYHLFLSGNLKKNIGDGSLPVINK